MSTPGDDTSDPGAPGGHGVPAGSGAGRMRRVLVALVALDVLVVIGIVTYLAVRGGDDPGPLDSGAPALANAGFRPTGCTFDADRGGLVTHWDVSTREAGRFTVDVEAVPEEGIGNLDVTTTHAVRVTVPFYEGQTRKRFDVVVPLSRSDYQDGYRKCRYTLNPGV
jgi:hypothetical protein